VSRDRQTPFNLNSACRSRQARLKWVLPEVKDDKGEGFLVFQTIWNLSLRSQVFRDLVSALLPGENLKGRNLRELVGKAAHLTIEHNDAGNQVYANVASVKPLKAKAKALVLDPGQLAYFSRSRLIQRGRLQCLV
jgi:hypothetical protein